ncbi:MAG: hypothetical protein WBG73_02595 [Coleofasciculaceae cyanobacterium]
MLQLQEKFIEAITKDCLLAATQVRKLIFQLRFNPENKERSNKEIAVRVRKQLEDAGTIYESNELKEIIRALVNKFEDQMIKDEVNVEYLKSNEPGHKGKWQLVYDWLWQKYFPRWSLETQWQELVAKADKTDDWLQVEELTPIPVDRNVGRLKLPKPTISLNAYINLIVNWRGKSRYLLLLNQGTSGEKFCICPSKLFAPSNQLSQQEMRLPQDDVKHPLFFEDQGKEHFLGIVMEQPLELAWLRPNDQEDLPALDAGRLHELLEKLELQGNWQMFYKSFEVV